MSFSIQILYALYVFGSFRDGFLVLPHFWDQDTIQRLRSSIMDIVQSADLTNVDSVFSTKEDSHVSDDYFLGSGREIRFFWEEKAKENGALTRPPHLAINKIGHGLHDLHPAFEQVSYHAAVGRICVQLGLVKPLVAQSMYIFKQPGIGGEVGAHQDGAFLYTEPQSVLGFWWALDDCTEENGCLWAVPGSHHLGVNRRFRRVDPPGRGVEFRPSVPVEWDLTGAVPVVVDKGALVLIHNSVVHFSSANTSDKPRHAFTIHVIDGREGVVYPGDNWLQRPPEFPFREVV